MTEIYWRGNKAKYTGKIEKLYGGVFWEIEILDGHMKGQKKFTPRDPNEELNIGEHDNKW